MPVWGWVLIAVAAVAIVALIVMRITAKRKTNQLQEQFGPEYDRTIEEQEPPPGGVPAGRARRAARAARHQAASAAACERYEAQWSKIQAQFVDSPQAAVAAGGLADPGRHARPRLPRAGLRPARRRRLGRPSAGRRELPQGPRARRRERERQGHDGGSPPGHAPLPRALHASCSSRRRTSRRRVTASRSRRRPGRALTWPSSAN